ncbi:hypothetical protein BAUCODRAFT_37561 [Baudoinia panamericana UAMH 10762]|uniref:Uncharacterized protein n=1 Tax=Baudoinia panamericana (strain UAMH 10762) TaxID=717646 RepID=M2LF48_BAUPA|nr:uncharacterized protein BAUCODRAFT_37561 [Baudoinia panamericana UAMH 10762]EMC92657.1 hypothetical protein BAUCODRAFT_37561 [Baudoinia panamericana UAMH 10762]
MRLRSMQTNNGTVTWTLIHGAEHRSMSRIGLFTLARLVTYLFASKKLRKETNQMSKFNCFPIPSV